MKKIKAMLAAVMMLAALPVTPVMTVNADGGQYDGTYVLRNVRSGLYLHAGSTDSGANVDQWSAEVADKSNTWTLLGNEDGEYSLVLTATTTASGLSLGVTDGNLCLKDWTETAQLFELSANADGSFKLLSKADGQAVEIKNAGTDDGDNAQLWEVNGENCQDWELIPVSMCLGEETPCTAPSPEDYIPGDLNGDEAVDVFDLALAKQLVLAGKDVSAVDVDADGTCGVVDLAAISKFLHTGKGGFKMRQTSSFPRIYAAVDGTFEKGFVESEHSGFTAENYLNLYNEIGSDMSLNVEVSETGLYALTVHYANGGTAARTVNVAVGGGLGIYTLTGAPTANWDTWEEETIYVQLAAGVNTITLTSATADGAGNLDTISISRADATASESPKTPIEPIRGRATSGGNNVWGEGYQMEHLSRGLVAANTGSGMMLTWRILATDAEKTSYKLYKNGELLADIQAGSASNYFDEGGTAADKYTIDTYFGNTCVDKGSEALVFGTKNSGQSGAYFDIATTPPTDTNGTGATYTENDCSVGDVDGDGVYEIFVKWDPSNSQDNSKTGATGAVFIDCYRLDGTMLWRIDLGKNIRAGAHYTQFMVYDFDGDGKAEMICKTADGTKDGKGNTIGDGSKDWRNTAGTVLDGPEYITLFDGLTGAALDTADYVPVRGAQSKSTWGDEYGNRSERYTACVAYLDGQNPSAIFGRGYYTRLAVAAWDVKDKKLTQRWIFDTGFDVNAAGYGDGNHQELAADVDGDGKQEVVCGSAVIDDNGKLLYTTSNAHGDAMHIGDFDLSNPGLEIFQCLEDEKHPNGKAINFGIELRDAKTGKALYRETAGGDTGRCICDNLVAGNAGAEMNGSHSGDVRAAFGSHEVLMQWSDITKWGQNSLLYWTDTLERCVLDRTMADQYGKGRVFTGDGVTYNNYTKSNMCLTCDLTGDYREEIIARKSDGGLRVFTTTYATEYPVYSLMHNPQYRVQVAAQNNSYNQPPHVDYFLGTGYDLPTAPTVFDYTAAH